MIEDEDDQDDITKMFMDRTVQTSQEGQASDATTRRNRCAAESAVFSQASEDPQRAETEQPPKRSELSHNSL
jgi:hypothetical protein